MWKKTTSVLSNFPPGLLGLTPVEITTGQLSARRGGNAVIRWQISCRPAWTRPAEAEVGKISSEHQIPKLFFPRPLDYLSERPASELRKMERFDHELLPDNFVFWSDR